MDYQPSIPTPVRDAVYISGLILGAATVLAAGIIGVWFPDLKDQVDATGVYVSGFVTVIVGGLGTIYRPGAQP